MPKPDQMFEKTRTKRTGRIVRFSFKHLNAIYDEACFRRETAVSQKKTDKMKQQKYYHAEIDFLGVLGEAAAAMVLGGKINKRAGTDDGCDISGLPFRVSVKTPTLPTHNLVVPQDQKIKEDYYVLVLPVTAHHQPGSLTMITDVDVVGYIDLAGFQKHATLEHLRGKGNPPSWVVRVKHLLDIDDLIDISMSAKAE